MSKTDLEFCHDLPKIRISQLSPAIKPIQTPEPSDALPAVRTRPAARRRDADAGENECRTPTAAEHRIPVLLTCPPAPRKPARAPACKRKLAAEFDFFEATSRDDVEEFFRSSFVVNATKRNRCPCK